MPDKREVFTQDDAPGPEPAGQAAGGQAPNEEKIADPAPAEARSEPEEEKAGYKKAFFTVSVFFILALVFYVGTVWISHSRATRLSFYGEIAAVTAAPTEKEEDEEAIPTLNVNTASAEELARLPGLGPTRAEAIVKFRQEYGLITEAEDLLNCPGIGKKTLEKFAEYLIFTDPAAEQTAASQQEQTANE